MLSDEERKAIERLSLKAITSSIEAPDYPNAIVMKKDLIIILNLIEKQSKEIEQEKEKNKKAIEMLQDHIKHCEQESEGSLNNEICHIALKFDKHLLQELLEE